MKVLFITSEIFVGKRCGGFGKLVYVDPYTSIGEIMKGFLMRMTDLSPSHHTLFQKLHRPVLLNIP